MLIVEMSQNKAAGFQDALRNLCADVDRVAHLRSQQRTPREYEVLSQLQLTCTFAIARLAILTTLFSQCVQDPELAQKTWAQIHFN